MTALDVVGVGNALVDVISSEEEDFLARHGLVKGTMALIDTARAEELYAAMGTAVEISGGGAANTLAALASLGGKGAFIGRIRDDQLGEVFAHDLRAVGVAYRGGAVASGPPTGRCLIVVTPDAQRTLNTFLGASAELGPEDVDEAAVASARVTYLEGYLFDAEPARRAAEKAASVAHESGGRVALTLSDPFCAVRFRSEFLSLLDHGVDLLFANEAELTHLYESASPDEALAEAAARCEVVALTRGPAGCTVVVGGERHDVAATPVEHVVDTTGAGDSFAAGFLHGLTTGRDPRTCAVLGTIAAAEVISHYGARPAVSLAELVAPVLA